MPGYATWLRTTHPEAFRNAQPGEQFEWVYVDAHDVLHNSARRASSDEHAIKLFFQRLNRVVHELAPAREGLVLAADGPGPLAKVLRQRDRRRKGQSGAKAKRAKLAGFDSLKMSAGTDFMVKVHDAFLEYGARKIRELALRSVVVDGPLVPGEGEVKCLGHLYAGPKVRGRHALVGGDSDLVLGALFALSHLADDDASADVCVVDFATSSSPGKGGRKADAALVLSARALATALALEAASTKKKPRPTAEPASLERVKAIGLDHAMLSIVARGNDYLPTLRGVLGFEMLWKAYLTVRALDPERCSVLRLEEGEPVVNWTTLGAVLDAASAALGAPKRASPLASGAKAEAERRRHAETYRDALQWNLRMYARGRCDHYRFETPGPTTLAAFRDVVRTAAADQKRIHDPRSVPPLPAIYNLLVQPTAGRALVNAALRPLMDESSEIGWLWSNGTSCCECRELWERRSPLENAVREAAPRLDEAMQERYEIAMAKLQPVREACSRHAALAHDGATDLTVFRELPRLELVERLALSARAQNAPDPANPPERDWDFAQPTTLQRTRRQRPSSPGADAPRASERKPAAKAPRRA